MRDGIAGELTYTSFDAPGSVGGWQVKQRRGLDQELIDHVVQGVRTQFQPGVELPPFPTAEQRAHLPRSLVYRRRSGLGVWWHAVPAGQDGSGRPGNVFSHVMVRTDIDLQHARPIEWWRSTDWLTPYGPREVASAQLGPEAPHPGTSLPLGRVLARLRSRAEVDLLITLTYHLLTSGPTTPPVVLAATNEEEAAQWVALLSHVLSPPQAAALAFVIPESAAAIPGESEELVLRCLCGDEADRLPSSARVTLIDARPDSPGRPAEPGCATESDWAALIRVAVAEPALLELRDTLVQRVGAVGADPFWSLAMACLWYLHDDDDDEIEGVRDLASEIVLHSSPEELSKHDDLMAVAEAAVTHLSGNTAAHSWERLLVRLDEPASVISRVLAEVHLTRVLAAPWSLVALQQGQLGVPEATWWQSTWPPLDPAALSKLARSLRQAPESIEHRLLATLGLAELIASCASPGSLGVVEEDLAQVLGESWSADPTGWWLPLGPLSPPVAALAQRLFDTDPTVQQASLGRAMPFPALSCMCPSGRPASQASRFALEHALTRPDPVPDDLLVGAVSAFHDPLIERPRDLDHERTQLFHLLNRPWSVPLLLGIPYRDWDFIDDRELVGLVLSEPDSNALGDVVDQLLGHLGRDVAWAAEVRNSARQSKLGRWPRPGRAQWLFERLGTVPIAEDVAAWVQSLVLSAPWLQQELPLGIRPWVQQEAELRPTVLAWMAANPLTLRELASVVLCDPAWEHGHQPLAGWSVTHQFLVDGQAAYRWWSANSEETRERLFERVAEDAQRFLLADLDARELTTRIKTYLPRTPLLDRMQRHPRGDLA